MRQEEKANVIRAKHAISQERPFVMFVLSEDGDGHILINSHDEEDNHSNRERIDMAVLEYSATQIPVGLKLKHMIGHMMNKGDECQCKDCREKRGDHNGDV